MNTYSFPVGGFRLCLILLRSGQEVERPRGRYIYIYMFPVGGFRWCLILRSSGQEVERPRGREALGLYRTLYST